MATKNFSDKELQCKCGCGGMSVTAEAQETLQRLRDLLGKPIKLNSAYRCPEHNTDVGGSPNSQHVKGTAFDISIHGQDKFELERLAKVVGFKGFGYYSTFLHVDLGRDRFWGDEW